MSDGVLPENIWQRVFRVLTSISADADEATYDQLSDALRNAESEIQKWELSDQQRTRIRRDIVDTWISLSIRKSCPAQECLRLLDQRNQLGYENVSEKYQKSVMVSRVCIADGLKETLIKIMREVQSLLESVEVSDEFVQRDRDHARQFIHRIESDSLPPF